MEKEIEDRAGKPQLIKATLNLRKDEEKVGFTFNFMKDIDTENYKPLLRKGAPGSVENIKLSSDQQAQISNVIAQQVSDADFKKKYDELPDDNPVKQAAKSIFQSIGGSLKDAMEKMQVNASVEVQKDENSVQAAAAAQVEAKIAETESESVKVEEKQQDQYKPILAKSKEEQEKEKTKSGLTRTQETNDKIAKFLTQDQRDAMINAYNMLAQTMASQGQQPISFDDYVDSYIDLAQKQQAMFLAQQQQQMMQPQYVPIAPAPMMPQPVQAQPVPFYIY